MTSDLLRRAAHDMRAKAEAATPGPWRVDGRGMVASGGRYIAGPVDENAAHIAAWHPAVALAVADWLDMTAGHLVAYGPNADSPWVKPHTQMALALARTYLGEQP